MTFRPPTRQVPGVYRHRVGEAIVTTLSDGGTVPRPEMLQNIAAEQVLTLRREAGLGAANLTALNTFLVQTAAHTVLIDCGAGVLMGPSAGRLHDSLAAAGVAPGDIDIVLLTHLHIDHVGGLLDPDGQPAFANARVLAPQAETDFWLDPARAAAAPDARRPAFETARRMTAPYGARLQAFDTSEPVPGITAVPLPGHTPGHTGYAIGGAGGVLIWGDIVHAPDVQSRHPEAAVIFDIDQPAAIATRRAILARAADERLLVAGMHMHFPAFARVVRQGEAYALQPLTWQLEL